MSDAQALLRAILLNPAEDMPRLMLADWCDENRQPMRAEFIRLQVAIANAPTRALCDRQRELWESCVTTHGPAFKWLLPVPGRDLFLDACSPIAFLRFKGNTQDARCDVVRGFFKYVRIMPHDFVPHAAELFASHPITGVRLAGRDPEHVHGVTTRDAWGWDFEMAGVPPRSQDIPLELWRLLLPYRPDEEIELHGWYDTEADARTALSDACVRYGRQLAGLPPLVAREAVSC